MGARYAQEHILHDKIQHVASEMSSPCLRKKLVVIVQRFLMSKAANGNIPHTVRRLDSGKAERVLSLGTELGFEPPASCVSLSPFPTPCTVQSYPGKLEITYFLVGMLVPK